MIGDCFKITKTKYYLHDNMKSESCMSYNPYTTFKNFIFLNVIKNSEVEVEGEDDEESIVPLIVYNMANKNTKTSVELIDKIKDRFSGLPFVAFGQLNGFFRRDNSRLKSVLKALKNKGEYVILISNNVICDNNKCTSEIIHVNVLGELAKLYLATSPEKAILLYAQSLYVYKNLLEDITNSILVKCFLIANLPYNQNLVVDIAHERNIPGIQRLLRNQISSLSKELLILFLDHSFLSNQPISSVISKFPGCDNSNIYQIATLFYRGVPEKGIKQNPFVSLEIYKFLAMKGCKLSLYQAILMMCKIFMNKEKNVKIRRRISSLIEGMEKYYNQKSPMKYLENSSLKKEIVTGDYHENVITCRVNSPRLLILYLEANKYLKRRDVISMITSCFVTSLEDRKRFPSIDNVLLEKIIHAAYTENSLYSLCLIAKRFKMTYLKNIDFSALERSTKMFDYLIGKKYIPAFIFKVRYSALDNPNIDAMKYLEKASNLGSLYANFHLANMRYKFNETRQQSVEIMEKISQHNDSLALAACRILLNHYTRVEKNFLKYLEYLKKAYSLGSTSRIDELAVLSYRGHSSEPPNLDECKRYLKIGSEKGNKWCIAFLAKLYLTGMFATKINIHKAICLYKRAHSQGCTKSTSKLGEVYYSLWKKEKDEREKLRWVKKALKYFIIIENIRPSVRRYMYDIYKHHNTPETSVDHKKSLENKINEGCLFSKLQLYCNELDFSSPNDTTLIDLSFDSLIEKAMIHTQYKAVLLIFANFYKQGKYVEKDEKKAIAIFEKLAIISNSGCGNYVFSIFTDEFKDVGFTDDEKKILAYCQKSITDIPSYERAVCLFYEYWNNSKTNNNAILLKKMICSRIYELIEGQCITPFATTQICAFLSAVQIKKIVSFFLSCKRKDVLQRSKNVKHIIMRDVIRSFIKENSK